MKMFSRLVLLTMLFTGLILAGCGGPTGTELTGDARDQTLEYIDPIADTLLDGLKAKDYAAFSQDFNDEMRKAIDETKFNALYSQLNDQIGAYQSRSISKVTDFDPNVTAEYAGVFSKTDKVNIVITVTKAEPHKVTGLYFR